MKHLALLPLLATLAFASCGKTDLVRVSSVDSDAGPADGGMDSEKYGLGPECTGFNAVWGSGSNDVWAAGDCGLMAHFDGNSWSTVDVGVAYVNGLWGSSASNMYAVGGLWHLSTDNWRQVILDLEGGDWIEVVEGNDSWLLDISGSSADDVYVVGGEFYNFDGNAWQVISGDYLDSVFAAEYQNVYVLQTSYLLEPKSDGQTVVGHYDGSEIMAIFETPMGEVLKEIWCSAPDECIAVGCGSDALAYHLEDEGWTKQELPSTPCLEAVWGLSGSDVIAVGWLTAIARYDGVAWTVWPANILYNLRLTTTKYASQLFFVPDKTKIIEYGN